ncbi:MAG: hypothetical protein M3010_11500 [Candidatus Dormibacteraeota bacterium]|nr:hypothetical protein [Candidatus Dormibacteraeota bacterium]
MGLLETLSGLEEEGWKALAEGRAAEFYAQGEGSPRYQALMTSTYVRRSGTWKLALHQQTPIPDGS